MDLQAICDLSPNRRKQITKTFLIVKITAIILLSACLQVSASGYAQSISLSEKNAPLESVMKKIEQQTGYTFWYKIETIEKAKKVTVEVSNATLDQVLKICFKDQELSYNIVDKTIVVEEKKAGKQSGDLSPPIDVHGRVTDSLGNPLQGASITVKGMRNKGTIADKDGNFTIKGIAPNSTIVISIVGYEEQQIKLGDRTDIVVVLRQGITSMHDVVISKGYYNTSERLNTGDVSVVSGEEINKQPVTDPILALEGRVPGLYIQQTSGAPGAYSTILIMGQNSIANGSDPFYIIDGVPFSSTSPTSPDIGGGMLGFPQTSGYNVNGVGTGSVAGLSPFNLLNPADIESIEVLKDADATAIYGSRGANGVILITTRKGKAGNTRVDANVSSGVGNVTHMIPLMNTQQYLAMRHEAFQNDGLSPQSGYDFDLLNWDTTRYTNWQKVLIGNSAPFTNAQISLSGGSANTQFVAGGGYSNQGTVFPGSYSDKKGLGLSQRYSFFNR